MTTANHATRAALHGQLDALLTPHRTVAPPVAGQADTGSLVDELQGVLNATAAARRALAALSDQAGASLSEAGSFDADFYDVGLYEGNSNGTMYDPPMEADPLGLGPRMAELREAIDVRLAPRQAAPVDPRTEVHAARLAHAQQCLNEIVGN